MESTILTVVRMWVRSTHLDWLDRLVQRRWPGSSGRAAVRGSRAAQRPAGWAARAGTAARVGGANPAPARRAWPATPAPCRSPTHQPPSSLRRAGEPVDREGHPPSLVGGTNKPINKTPQPIPPITSTHTHMHTWLNKPTNPWCFVLIPLQPTNQPLFPQVPNYITYFEYGNIKKLYLCKSIIIELSFIRCATHLWLQKMLCYIINYAGSDLTT